MSNPKWLIFIVSVWITIMILGTIMEAAWVGKGETSIMNTLQTLPVFVENGSVIGAVIDPSSWGALYSMMTLNFAFFDESTEIIRWIVFLPLAIPFTILFLFFLASHLPVIGRGSS